MTSFLEPIPTVESLIIRPRGMTVIRPGEEDDDFTNDTGGTVVMFGARQGGGNDECWCEEDPADPVVYAGEKHESSCLWLSNRRIEEVDGFITMVYDQFDSTYCYFYFRYPGTVDEYLETARTILTEEQERAENERRIVAAARGFLPDAVDDPNFGSLVSSFDSINPSAEETIVAEVDARIAELSRDRAAILTGDRDVAARYNVPRYVIEQVDVHLMAVRNEELLAAAREEIDALPEDSALRAALFADQGMIDLPASGKGRNRRPARSVPRQTVMDRLVDALSDTAGLMELRETRARRAEEPVTRLIDAAESQRRRALARIAEYEEAKRRLFG